MTNDVAMPRALDAEPAEDVAGDGAAVHGQVIHLITTVGPPLTIATALLFYFGWVRTSVEAETLGVSDTVFGYSTQDYIMRSISALFLPVVAAAGLGIVAVLLHGWVVTDLHAPRSRRRRRVAGWLASACLPAFFVLPVVSGLAEAYWSSLTGLILPLGLGLGLLLTTYGASLRRQVDAVRPRSADEHRRATLVRVLVTVLVAATLFWWVGDFAAVVGRGLAYQIASNIERLPGVVVYSPTDLQISAPGVRASRLSGDATAYYFRYQGLRLLERSDGRLFLLPDGWTIGSGTLVVLPDSGQIRVEYTHG